mmetsp:Transcript_5506/g.9332  ORF Transcript_5506/g.9332 Transcript_5506/m.9332 type:complete len:120 (+) Transcript_5506:1206-1565(+)
MWNRPSDGSSLTTGGSRVMIGGDMIARVPPRALGGAHGIVPRLLLNVANRSFDYSECDADDDLAWTLPVDSKAHVSHALYLAGETTPGRPTCTIPLGSPWPVSGDGGSGENSLYTGHTR